MLIVITISFFSFQKGMCATFEADYVPWSGYWWPATEGGLVTGWDYRGYPAPLEKYDYVTSGTYDGPATSFGTKCYYDRDAVSWSGLCFLWSVASVVEEEPVHKGIYKDTVFYVGDKKGLLTAAYLGARYNSYSTEEPADFHQMLEDFIAYQNIPVVMDMGTDGEHWNYPVFKYDTDYTQDGSIRHYTTTIYYVSDNVDPDIVGALVLTRTFYYYFISDQDGNITESGWENGTVPPVMAYEALGTAPVNSGLTYEKVKEIVNTTDDPYEENDSFESALPLSSGKYTLIAMDSDYFRIELEKNDKLNIRAISEESGIYLRIYSPDRGLIQEKQGTDEEIVVADNELQGTYYFEVAPVIPSAEPVYDLFIQHTLSYQGIFPVYPSGRWDSGIALLTPDKSPFTADRMFLTLVNKNGSPQDSVMCDSLSVHQLGMAYDSFGLAPLLGNEYIRVDSDIRFWGLQTVSAEYYDLMLGANFIPLDKAGSDLFFPFFNRTGGWKTMLGIINTGDQTEEISLQSYDSDGYVLVSDILELAPGEKWERDASSFSILAADAKTMSAVAASGRECLAGYIEFLNPYFGSKGRALVPLTNETGPELVIPHIASTDEWNTQIAVMNTGDDDSPVIFSAYDAKGNLIDVSEYLLNAKQNFVSYASDIFENRPVQDIASIRIVSQNSQPMCGLMLYGTVSEFQLAGVPIHPPANSSLYLSHIASNQHWWTGIGLMNAGDVPTDISFTLFKDNGQILGEKTEYLNPGQQLSRFAKDLFSDDIIGSARYMKIESETGQPINGIYLMGTKDGRRLMGDVMR
ncbi:MAG: hypothetical protein GY749_32195 [Desulfobacteraceae bacterium]|nr:hypothetical protein [Desulfobacteraceae bacterium]